MTTPSEIALLTTLLRTSPDRLWARHRELLLARGINPETAILAESFPDDADFEFGVLVTADRRVIQFGLDYLQKDVVEREFREWEDITDRYVDSPYCESAKAALEMLPSRTKFGPG
jgi:hypothetical protein